MVSTTRENSFSVEMREDGAGWRVAIVDPDGAVVAERACRDQTEARTYASTVSVTRWGSTTSSRAR
jgi:hypothetical protein